MAQAPTEPFPTDTMPYLIAQSIPYVETQLSHLVYDPRSCISYVKARMHITEPLVSPLHILQGKTSIIVSHGTPQQGMAVILHEGPVDHVAYIDSVSNGKMHISEANYHPGQYSERIIQIDSPLILGFF